MTSIEDRSERRSLIKIDQDRLDQVCLEHAELYYEWQAKLANAREAATAKKNALEVVEAELIIEFHRNPEKWKLPSTTAPVIKAAVTSHPKMRAAEAELQKANERTAAAWAMIYALDHRKKMIELSVQLFLANYRSTPYVNGDGRATMSEGKKKIARRPINDEDDDD